MQINGNSDKKNNDIETTEDTQNSGIEITEDTQKNIEITDDIQKNEEELKAEADKAEIKAEADKAEFYRRRKMSYSIRLLCAVYLSYLVYSLASGISETAGTERIIIIFFMVFFAVFDIWCYISGFKGLKKLKEMQ